MVTPRQELSRLTPGQLFREEGSGRLSQREVVAELQRRQRIDRERRQRQMAQQERQQELADVQAQRRSILSTPRARQVAQDVLERRRQVQPAATIERIAPIPVIAPEPPPVRREEVRQLSSEEIAQRVERRQLGAGQAQAELQRRASEAPSASDRQRAQQALQRVPAISRTRELPQDIQRFTSSGGTNLVRARQSGISEERLIREGFTESDVKGASATARAINQLRPFVDAQGNVDINEAVKKLDSETLQQAGISRTSIALAKQQNLGLKKLEKYTDKEGNVNLAAAKRAGVSNKVIKDAGFSDQDVNAAARRVIAFNRLAPFAVRDPKTKEVGIDLVAAVSSRELLGGGFVSEGRQRGVNDQLLRDAGFTQPQINEAREVAKQLNPLPNTRQWYAQIGKEVGVQAADALVPGLWARNWNKLSNKDRAINIAFDALYVVPLVGAAARTTGRAARAASRLSRAERATKKTLSSVKAAQRTEASDIGKRLETVQSLTDKERLQQLNILVRTEQQKARIPNFQKRIDRINAIDDELRQRRQLESLARDLAKTGAQKDILKGRISATDVNKRLDSIEKLQDKEALQQLNRLVRSEQSKLKNPDFQKRINRINEIDNELRQRRELVSLARDLPSVKPGPDILKGRVAASDIDNRLKTINESANKEALQQLNRLVRSEQVKARIPNFQKRIDRINAIDDELRQRELLTALAREAAAPPKFSGIDLRVAENNLTKVANAIRKTVRAAGGSATDATAAQKATLEIGNALLNGTPKALPAPAQRLALIGRKYDIPSLEQRVRPILTAPQGQKVSDLFQNARRTADDLPDAPGNVKNRINRIEDSLKSIDERLKDIPERKIETLEQDIKATQEKIESLRRRPSTAAREQRLEKLQERLQETRRQVKVAERPVQPLIEVKTISQVAQPIATRQQAARVIAQQRSTTRSIAKPLDVAEVVIKPAKAAKRVRVKAPVAIRPTAAMTEAELSVLALPVRRQRASTRIAISQRPAEQLRQRQQVADMLRQELQEQRQEVRQSQTQLKQAQQQKQKQQLQQKLAQQEKQVQQTEVKLKQQEKLVTQTRLRAKTTTKAPPKITRKAAASPKFDLPGDAEKALKPGEFPRVVTWRQGVTNITVDIDKGTRTFSRAKGTGKGITPDETFKVVTKDKTPPTPKEFDQGVVKLNVTPRRVFFSRRRLKD